MEPTTKHTFQKLQKVLDTLNQEGKFEMTVLTDLDGLPIAASNSPTDNAETQAAIVSRVQKLISQVGDYLGMGLTDEVSFNDIRGKKLVCRSFQLNGNEMILALLLSGRQKTYRRLTNQAIIQLQRMMVT